LTEQGGVAFLPKIAWRNLWRSRRRTLIALCATATGTAACIVTVSLVDGWYDELVSAATRHELGHLQVHAAGYLPDRSIGITLPPGVEGGVYSLKRMHAAPRVVASALAGAGDRSATVRILGIDPVREASVTGMATTVESGHVLGDVAAGEVVLGWRLARALGVADGGEVVLLTEADDGFPGEGVFRVAGISRTGDDAADRGRVLMHIDDARRLLALEGRTHEIALLTSDAGASREVADRLSLTLGPECEVAAWQELSPVIWGTVRLADAAVCIVLAIVFGLAGLGIANTVMMSVIQRRREFGLLMALGMGPARVVALVVLETGFLALLASMVGAALGLAIAGHMQVHGWDLSGVVSGVAQGGVTIGPVVHARISASRLALTLAVLGIVAVAASVGPAIRAARLDPARAARGR
jgi:ABC-type lipoprotein release transport system permease subunit